MLQKLIIRINITLYNKVDKNGRGNAYNATYLGYEFLDHENNHQWKQYKRPLQSLYQGK